MKIFPARIRSMSKATGTLLSLFALHCAALAPFSCAQAADITQGRALIERNNCASCHGADFNQPISSDYPKLAGQYADYLYYAMRDYQQGKTTLTGRDHEVMKAQLQSLSDADLKDMAAYLESLPGQVKTNP